MYCFRTQNILISPKIAFTETKMKFCLIVCGKMKAPKMKFSTSSFYYKIRGNPNQHLLLHHRLFDMRSSPHDQWIKTNVTFQMILRLGMCLFIFNCVKHHLFGSFHCGLFGIWQVWQKAMFRTWMLVFVQKLSCSGEIIAFMYSIDMTVISCNAQSCNL